VQTEKGADMTSEQLFLLTIGATVTVTVAIMQVRKRRRPIKPATLESLYVSSEIEQRKPREPEEPITASEPRVLTAEEEESKAELERLQRLINRRKQIARQTDISHHLWNLYKSQFRSTSPA